MVLAEKADGFASTVDAADGAVVVDVVIVADGAAGFGDLKANIPLPIGDGLLSSLLAVAAGAVVDAKPNEGLPWLGAASVALAVVAPAANDPKVTVDFFCSVTELVLLVVADVVVLGVPTVAGCPNEKPVPFAGSAGLLAAGEPKLNPPLVVVEVTDSELFGVSDDFVGLEPKLNPPEPKETTAAVVDSFFSLVFELSVVSDEAEACLIPKLNPLPSAGAAAVLPLLPKLNLAALSSELVVLVVDVTEPKLKPAVPVDVVVSLADELAGTPKENPVVLGASCFPSES